MLSNARGWTQTICTELRERSNARCAPAHTWDRRKISLIDRGVARLDWYGLKETSATYGNGTSKAVILLCPGLAGGSESTYIKAWYDWARANEGFGLAVYNRRGIAQAVYPGTQIGLAADVGDAQAVLDHISAVRPNTPIIVVGYSAGGVLAMRIATSHPSRVRAAVSVSSCIKPARMKLFLEKNPLIDHILGVQTEKGYRGGGTNISQLLGIPNHQMMLASTIERRSAEYNGFSGIDSYLDYLDASDDIIAAKTLPTLHVIAKNDPVLPTELIVRDMKHVCDRSPLAQTVITEEGGHVGWDSRWLIGNITEFVHGALRL